MMAIAQGVRALLRRPGFTVLAVVTLAIGIGSMTTMFSVANGLFLRGLPGVREQERLVRVQAFGAEGEPRGWSLPNVEDLQAAGTGLDVAALSDRLVSIRGTGAASTGLVQVVTPNYFRVVGVAAAVGRLFGEGNGADDGVVLSHAAWLTHFAGDPRIAGRSVRLNGQPLTVLGVLPEGFNGTFTGFSFDVWAPVGLASVVAPGDNSESRGETWLEIVARLPEGMTRGGAGAALALAAVRLSAAYPEHNAGLRLEAKPLTGFDDDIRAGALGLTALLLVVGVLVLGIACANTAGLLFARGAARRHELALRTVLGADRRGLVWMLLLEAGVLAVGGGLLGLLITGWGADALLALQPPLPVRVALDFTPDLRVLSFATLVTFATALAAGLLPALRATGARAELLRAGTVVRGARMWRGFVIAQVAGSLVLLVTALLFVRTLRAGEAARIGFDPDGVVAAPLVNFSLLGLEPDIAANRFDEWIDRIERDPGVERAALVRNVPLGLRGSGSTTIAVEGSAAPVGPDGFDVRFTAATPSYFDVMRIPILAGRAFDERDRADAPPVALVSEAFARRFWPDGSAVGRRVTRGAASIEIVGVVRDVSIRRADTAPVPYLYLPIAQWPTRDGDVVVRERVAGAGASAIVHATRAVVPDLPLSPPLPLAKHIGLTLLPQRVAAAAGGVLGGLGVLLAALGVYGVLAFSFVQRRREIGVRMAIGAARGDIGRIILGDAARMAAVGIGIGALAAAAVARAIASMLHGVSPVDPVAFAGGAAIVAAVALIGAAVPLRRALRTDPMRALRSD